MLLVIYYIKIPLKISCYGHTLTLLTQNMKVIHNKYKISEGIKRLIKHLIKPHYYNTQESKAL